MCMWLLIMDEENGKELVDDAVEPIFNDDEGDATWGDWIENGDC